MRPVGVFGGTFDPVHYGHLRVALELYQGLRLDHVRLIPSNQPPHRGPTAASAEQRLAMLRAAAGDEPAFRVDEREIRRSGPSYMVDTLASLRRDLGDSVPLCLLLGMDAFLELTGWHRWQTLPELAHIVVAHRPGAELSPDSRLPARITDRVVDRRDALREERAGSVLVWPVTQLGISASAIRRMLRHGGNPRYLLPDQVMRIITARGLYRTPEQGA